MVVLAGLSAYYLRFSELSTDIRPVIFNLPLSEYVQVLSVIALVWLVIFSFAGLYNVRDLGSLKTELKRVVFGCSLGLVAVVILIFFYRELFSSRFIVLSGWIFSIIYVAIGRIILTYVRRFFYKYGLGVHKVVVIGAGATADRIVKEFSTSRWLGFTVVKRFDEFDLDASKELEEYLLTKEVDEILQADPNLSKADRLRLFDFAG
jgi:FlaA1/EpsC-like NDP-sugar epimerase